MSAIAFFDGECLLCNGFVDFLLARDRAGRLHFAPLQGETAREKLSQEFRVDLRTVVLWRDGVTWRESDAVLETLAELGGGWRMARIGRIIPRRLRDRIYRFVAANRFAWFGKRGACRMPTTEDRGRILL